LTETADEQWHYERDGRSVGPMDKAAIVELIRHGTIRPDTLLCLGQGDWIPARTSELSFLFTASQRAPWVYILISPFAVILSLNILVFLAMVVSGVDPVKPETKDLLGWGANFGPRTTGGEWWRLITSTFLHVGLLHLAFNMFVLFQIGPLMQRLMGRTGFVIAYFIAGLAGSLTSVAWNPYVVSAGASGAIFGLYGALLGFALVQRGKVPSEVMSRLVVSAVIFIGFNVAYGFARTGTDMAAHAGGLVGGFICSLGLCGGLNTESPKARMLRNSVVVAVAAILMVGAATALPRTIDLQAELKQFAEVESRTMAKFNAGVQNFRIGKLKAGEFASLLEKDVLPEWVLEHDAMSRLNGLPLQQGHLVSLIVKYMELRRDAWSDLAKGVRENQVSKLQDSTRKQQEAELVVQELGRVRRGQ